MNGVRCQHLRILIIFLVHDVIKDLSIREHPIAVEKKQNRAILHYTICIIVNMVVHVRRLLIRVGKLVSFNQPEDEEGQKRYWKEQRQSHPIEHRNKKYIQDIRHLGVQNVVRTGVQRNKSIDLLLLSLVYALILILATKTPYTRISG